eukprot:g909.t1
MRNTTEHVQDIEDSDSDDAYASDAFESTGENWEKMLADSPVAKRVFGCWEEHIDKNTGHPWWFNSETHVSSWDMPEEVQKKLRERHSFKSTKSDKMLKHRLAEANTERSSQFTPKKAASVSEELIGGVAMSPAYNNLLADVQSLRESLRVAESELNILAQKTPVKTDKLDLQTTEHESSNAVTLARADVRAQKVATEVARIEARLKRISERERSFLENMNGLRNAGSVAKGHTKSHSDKKKKVKKKKKKKKRSKDSEPLNASAKSAGVEMSSPSTVSRYRSKHATKSIARAMAAVEFAASPHAANAYVTHAATGSATKVPLLQQDNPSSDEDKDDYIKDEDTPRFTSVHRLCDDAISFASSLRFGEHMDVPTNASFNKPQKVPLAEENNGLNWKAKARGNALSQINKKLNNHNAKKLRNENSNKSEVSHHTVRMQESENTKSHSTDILSRDGLTQAEMEAKLEALQREMIKTAKLIDYGKRMRDEEEDQEEIRYRHYAGAVTIQTQWRGWSSRRRVDRLRHKRHLKSMKAEPSEIRDTDEMSQKWSQHRMHLARKLEEQAATKVQAQVRRRLARKDVVDAQMKLRNSRIARLKYVSARMIQSLFRGYNQRKLHFAWKKNIVKPVVVVQSEWRRFSATRRFQEQKLAQAQKVEMDRIRAEREQEMSALAVQSIYRGHLARRMISVENDAANDLQRIWRGRRGRFHVAGIIEEKTAATSVQSQWRRRQQQAEYRRKLRAYHEENAAVMLQAQGRAFLSRRQVERKVKAASYRAHLDSDAEERSATLIQASVRGRRDRILYRDVLCAKANCATRVQALYRGHLSRRLLTIYFVAAIRIQRFWKSKMLRIQWRRRALDVLTLIRADKLLATEMAESQIPSRTDVGAGGGHLLRRAVDEDGNNALMLASRAGSVRVVRICLTKGFDPTTKNTSDKQTALHLAASSGGDRTEIASMLIRAGADVAAVDSLGRSVVHVAATSGNEGILKLLCDRGVPLEITDSVAEVDATDLGGNTPLHLACAGGHAATVRTLLQFAADTSIANRSGDTAAHFAASMGREDCIHLLLDYNMDLAHARNMAGSTPMQAARSTGQVRLVKAIQQRLQVRANKVTPPTKILSPNMSNEEQVTRMEESASVDASDDVPTTRVLRSPPSMVSVTEEVDPFADHWGVPGPPPVHSPPNADAVREALRRRPGDRADISSDSESDDDHLVDNSIAPNSASLSPARAEEGAAAEELPPSHEQQEYGSSSTAEVQQYNGDWGEDGHKTQYGSEPVWQEMYDEHYQAVYYLDTVSGHSQWERPQGFVGTGAGGGEEQDSYREDLSNETWSA